MSNELHKPIITKFKRRKVYSKDTDHIWSSDLIELNNDMGYRYALTVIDLRSRFAWVVPLKNKRGHTLMLAFQQIFNKSKRKPKKLWTDEGTEFYNKIFMKFLKGEGIKLYSTFNEGKAVVIERFNRTLKEKLYKKFTQLGSQRWVYFIQDIVDNYNNTVHSSTKLKPSETFTKLEYEKEINLRKPKYKVGDIVRIYRWKSHFEKGYTKRWTNELFKIVNVIETVPWTYKLHDLNGEEILGSFYSQELQKTKLINH